MTPHDPGGHFALRARAGIAQPRDQENASIGKTPVRKLGTVRLAFFRASENEIMLPGICFGSIRSGGLANDTAIKARTVLVVDDDLEIRLFASRVLDDAGFTVFLASNAKGCLEQLGVVEPSVIMLDVNLPDASGYELCATIRDTYPNLNSTIFFATTNRTVDDVLLSKRAGGDYFMVKPFTADELLSNLRKASQAKFRRKRGQANAR